MRTQMKHSLDMIIWAHLRSDSLFGANALYVSLRLRFWSQTFHSIWIMWAFLHCTFFWPVIITQKPAQTWNQGHNNTIDPMTFKIILCFLSGFVLVKEYRYGQAWEGITSGSVILHRAANIAISKILASRANKWILPLSNVGGQEG